MRCDGDDDTKREIFSVQLTKIKLNHLIMVNKLIYFGYICLNKCNNINASEMKNNIKSCHGSVAERWPFGTATVSSGNIFGEV